MIYDYRCSCGNEFSVVKSISEYLELETCASCQQSAIRSYKSAPLGSVRGFDAAYYPTLGKGFHNKRQLQYHLDKNNLVEVGNDFGSGEKMQQHFDKQREDQRNKSWDKIEI